MSSLTSVPLNGDDYDPWAPTQSSSWADTMPPTFVPSAFGTPSAVMPLLDTMAEDQAKAQNANTGAGWGSLRTRWRDMIHPRR